MKKSADILSQERYNKYQSEGIELWGGLANWLNEEIRKTGQLQKNNHPLWDEYLHEWANREYAKVLSAMRDLMEQHPEMFKGFHEDAILNAEMILHKNWESEDNRVLDTKKYKTDAWKLIMTMREVWNKAIGIDLPNEDASRIVQKQEIHRTELFEFGA
jgi:hypothetical protein